MYLAETFDLMGKNKEENYQIRNLLFAVDDYIFNTIGGLMDKNGPCLLSSVSKFKLYVEKFEKRYVDLGQNKYFLGDKFTLADIIITCNLTFMNYIIKSLNILKIEDIAPGLYKLAERIKENELKGFFEKFYEKPI